MQSNGSYAIIEAVRAIHYDEAQTTYNFEVEGFHTYYVGSGVLVHNMSAGADCGGKSGKRHDKNQEALIELAQENKSGVTRSQGETLVSWAQEYGVNNHGPMIHRIELGIGAIQSILKYKKFIYQ